MSLCWEESKIAVLYSYYWLCFQYPPAYIEKVRVSLGLRENIVETVSPKVLLYSWVGSILY